jgi:hypothetical protein
MTRRFPGRSGGTTTVEVRRKGEASDLIKTQ